MTGVSKLFSRPMGYIKLIGYIFSFENIDRTTDF